MAAASHPVDPKVAAHRRRSIRIWDAGFLAAFTAATLLMVVAITVVGLVDAWWVLAPVMLVDFALALFVVSGIARLLSDDGE